MTAQPPPAVAAILSRVVTLSTGPAAVSALRARFELPLSGTAKADPAAAASVSAVAATGVAPVPPDIASSTASGTWVERIPNARGKALVPLIDAAAKRYGLEPAFLAAVFWTESSYHADAVSRTGAIGLGQLMPETAQWLGVDPWDPAQNIDGAARLYRYFLDRNHGDMSLAIASYAAGPNAVKRAGGIPDQFTANYIAKLSARTDYLAGRRQTPP